MAHTRSVLNARPDEVGRLWSHDKGSCAHLLRCGAHRLVKYSSQNNGRRQRCRRGQAQAAGARSTRDTARLN
jgi:hypothetical protein